MSGNVLSAGLVAGLLLLLALPGAPGAAAQDQDRPGPGIARGDQGSDRRAVAPGLAPRVNARLDEAERIGRLLFEKDRAAWHATGDLVARYPEHRALPAVSGWISDLYAEGAAVTFIGESDKGPVTLFRTRLHDGLIDTQSIPVRRLDPRYRAFWTARRTALEQVLEPSCTDEYNAAIIERGSETATAEDDAIEVYLLPAQPEEDAMPVGGFHRITLSPDGATVIDHHAFSEGCLVMRKSLEDGSRPALLAIGHPAGDLPEEHHVFLSLLHATPLLVVTETGQWMVRDGRITQRRPLR